MAAALVRVLNSERDMRVAAVLALSTLGILLHARAAAAECAIDVVRAPDDVRAAITDATKRVDRCHAFAVRVITTDIGMLYVIAIDTDGRVYEEIDRDRVAAVGHVMAWATEGITNPWRPPAAPGRAVVAPSGAPVGPGGMGPGGVPSEAASPGDPTETALATTAVREPATEPAPGTPAPAPSAGKQIGVGGVLGESSYGLRAELDIWTHGGFALGVAVGLSEGSYSVDMPWNANLTISDVRAVATAAHTWTLGESGAWYVRAHAGVGVIHTELGGMDVLYGDVNGTGTTPVGEGAIRAGRMIDDRWSLDVGGLLSIYAQNFPYRGEDQAIDRDYDTVFSASLRRRL